MEVLKQKLSNLKQSIVVRVLLIFVAVYLFMVILPNHIGCIVPEEMCMTGSSDLKEVLSISAALIPSLLVVYGYKIWRHQKVKELLAIQAQEIYFKLDDINKVLDDHKDFIKNTPELIKRNSTLYIEVKAACNKLKKELMLFKDLLEHEKSQHHPNFENFYNQLDVFDRNLRIENNVGTFLPSNMNKEITQYHEQSEAIDISILVTLIEEIKSDLMRVILHK